MELVGGEALFTVVPDAARPFIVRSGTVEVRAVGTEFSVQHSDEAVTVVVTEGRVAVERAAESAQPSLEARPALFASAGERITVPVRPAPEVSPTVTSLSAGEIAQALAWRGERIEFASTPLEVAVRQMNRGRAVPIELADPSLGQRTLTGVLWVDDSEGFVRLLESGFDLTAERRGDVVRLHPRR